MVQEKVFVVSQLLNNPDDDCHVYLVRDITSKPVCLCDNLARLHDFFEAQFGKFE